MENIQIIEKILSDEKIKYDEEMLKKVINFCEVEYKDKKKAGKPMMEHVIGVAKIVATLRIDDVSIYASLLHGIFKCENIDIKKLKEMFGDEVVDIVITVNKLSCLNIKNKDKVDSEMLRNMFLAIAKDIRTVIIKLADRLYNMQNISYVDNEEVKLNMAKECLQIYAPIAHRLGMSKVKSELEDISFRVLMPVEYGVIKAQIDEKKKERELYIDNRINEVKKELEKQNIEASIYGRPKHFYSIYKKMKQKHCNADDLFDLLAIRVIVNSVKDCYSVLGIVHDMYKPMPGRFKDYIAVPKTNMYQSLHTTVFGEGGKPFEIQIRTWDMHRIAEYGIAAHWAYKEASYFGKKQSVKVEEDKLAWLRESLEWQKDMQDPQEFLATLKTELFEDEVYVFTPKGAIKILPRNATPIDFAYSIHEEIGNHMTGCKVNSKMMPIITPLKSGDIIEIITSDNSKGPSRDWLKFVKSTKAKNKINGWFKKAEKSENIEKGKDLIEKEIKRIGMSHVELFKQEYIDAMLDRYKYKNLEDMYAAVGFGANSAVKVIARMLQEYRKEHQEENVEEKIEELRKQKESKQKPSSSGVVVEGIDNCLVKLSKCCNPLPGDEIIGYITKGRGVSVHRKDCVNVKDLLTEENRIIDVKWYEEAKENYNVTLEVLANDRKGLLVDILNTVKETKANLMGVSTKTTKERIAIMDIDLEVENIEELNKVIRNIKKVDSVYEVRR